MTSPFDAAALDTPGAVALLFDENNGVIGLKPIDPRRQNPFPVKKRTNTTTG